GAAPTSAPAAPAATTAPAAAAATKPAAAPPTSAPAAAAPATSAPAAQISTPPVVGQGGLKLPTYTPFQGPKPDLAGNQSGLDPAFFKFPSQLLKSVSKPPGDGSTVSAITYLTLAPPPPMDQNAAWQAVNKAINATLNLTMVAGVGEYAARVNVAIAGSEI